MGIRKDGKIVNFIDSKCCSLFNQGIKKAKIVWTHNWRILNKKIHFIQETKKNKKKSQKVQRPIGNFILEELERKKSHEFKKQAREKRNEILNKKREKKNSKKVPKKL